MLSHLDPSVPIQGKSTQRWWFSLKSALANLGEVLGTIIGSSREPVVTYQCTKDGVCFWRCYDPISQQTFRFATENEVLQWLERLPFTEY
ncbi:MAG: hypothetical protein VKK04_22235 [Synechococcales bacterium]|nr:hypothetical protein [Synechococcales bacterium]